ncbi:MAG: hypothetical protein RIE59_11790 [Imperialibacter sp.]
MRAILPLVLLSLLVGCYVYHSRFYEPGYFRDHQTASQPFQVLHAEGVYKRSDTALVKSLQFLSTSDTVKLTDSGYLMLVHHSGLFLEFDQDTTISVLQLAGHINDWLSIVPKDVKVRADIQRLFSDKSGARHWATGAVERNSYSPIWFSIPSSQSVDISPNKPELCLSWRCSDLKEHEVFVVQVKNIFDENIWEL